MAVPTKEENAIQTWSNDERTLTSEGGSGGLTEATLHSGLDSYTNKTNWKADVDTKEDIATAVWEKEI